MELRFQLREAGPGEIFSLSQLPPSKPASHEFLKLIPKDHASQETTLRQALERNQSMERAKVSSTN